VLLRLRGVDIAAINTAIRRHEQRVAFIEFERRLFRLVVVLLVGGGQALRDNIFIFELGGPRLVVDFCVGGEQELRDNIVLARRY